MRIVHTADWHLGRIFHNIHLTEDQAHVLEQFVMLVADVKPDAIIIAGDVYDRSVPPPEAVSLLDDVLSKILLDHRVPVLITAGNHDSPERLGFGDKVMARQGLYVFGNVSSGLRPVALEDSFGSVFFCPVPYAEPVVVRERLKEEVHSHEQAITEILTRIQSGIPAGVRRVAIAHAFVSGGTGSESERPLSIGGIETVDSGVFASFDYVALGHLHLAQQAGSERIRYPGSLLKYSFSEAGHRKSVSIVEINAAGYPEVETVELTSRRDVRCLEGYLEDILADAGQSGNKEDYVMATLKDRGAILDPIGKLRQIYPNILHLERASFCVGGDIQMNPGDHRRRTEADLFDDFFRQVTDEAMTDAEKDVLQRMIADFNRREREADV